MAGATVSKVGEGALRTSKWEEWHVQMKNGSKGTLRNRLNDRRGNKGRNFRVKRLGWGK